MSETGVQETIQIIELAGRSIGVLVKAGGKTLSLAGRAAKGTVKGTAKGITGTVRGGKAAMMRISLWSHYRSKGKRDSLSVKRMEKLTGGDYRICSIPTENEKELVAFYDRLKKLKIPFAEIPDLVPGDGFTQFIYNPQDAAKLKNFLDMYKFKSKGKPQDMTPEEWWTTGKPEEKEKFDKDLLKAAEEESKEVKKDKPDIDNEKEKIKEAQIKNTVKMRDKQPRKYIPLTIYKKNIVAEDKQNYYVRVPNVRESKGGEHLVLKIPKKEALVNTDGSLKTHLERKGVPSVYWYDSGKGSLIYCFDYKTGQELYNNHYDKRTRQKQQQQTKNKTKTTVKDVKVPVVKTK